MKKWKSRMVLGIIAITMALGLALSPGLVKADPSTLQDLINLGSTGWQIDDKLFYNFLYTPAGVAPTAGSIAFTQITDPGNPGLKFVAAWHVSAGENLDSNITYYVKVLPGGSPIHDVFALIAGAGFVGNGSVTLAENVFNEDKTQTIVNNLYLFNNSGGSHLSEEVLIDPNMGPLFVVKDIILTAGVGGDASLSYVENTYSEKVPEPMSLILLGSGLAGVGLYRRLRKPKG